MKLRLTDIAAIVVLFVAFQMSNGSDWSFDIRDYIPSIFPTSYASVTEDVKSWPMPEGEALSSGKKKIVAAMQSAAEKEYSNYKSMYEYIRSEIAPNSGLPNAMTDEEYLEWNPFRLKFSSTARELFSSGKLNDTVDQNRKYIKAVLKGLEDAKD